MRNESSPSKQHFGKKRTPREARVHEHEEMILTLRGFRVRRMVRSFLAWAGMHLYFSSGCSAQCSVRLLHVVCKPVVAKVRFKSCRKEEMVVKPVVLEKRVFVDSLTNFLGAYRCLEGCERSRR